MGCIQGDFERNMKKAPKAGKRRRRVVIGAVLGTVLAVVTVGFCDLIYNPFATDIPDLKSLVPNDAAWVVEVRDFPTFIKGLENREFYSRLDQDRGFQRFVNRQEVRRNPVVGALREMFRSVVDSSSTYEMPFGLEIIGDVSGVQVVVAGYPPEPGALEPGVLCAFKPTSWMAVAAVNLLLSPKMCQWFIADRMPEITVRHAGGVALLDVPAGGRSVTVAVGRVGNAILAGTATDAIGRLVRRNNSDNLDSMVARRLRPEWAWSGSDDLSVSVAVDRAVLTEDVSFRRDVLLPSIGPDGARFIGNFLPKLDGVTIHMEGEIDEVATVRAAVDVSERRSASLFTSMPEIDQELLVKRLDEVGAIMPFYTFGVVHLSCHPSRLLRFAWDLPRFIDNDKKDVWADAIRQYIPRFQSNSEVSGGLQREFTACFDEEMSVFLFRKDRGEDPTDYTSTGWAVVLSIRDRDHLESLIGEIDKAQGDGVRVFDRFEFPEMDQWHISDQRFLDDPEESNPGFAIIGEHFVFTNWFQMLNDVCEVARGSKAPFGALDTVRGSLEESPEGSRLFAHINAEQLYEFIDSVKEGWVKERSEIDPAEMVQKRNELVQEAGRRGVPPDQREEWIANGYKKWKLERLRLRSPLVIRREMNAWLGYFRDVFAHGTGFAGLYGGRLRVLVRLAASSVFD